MNKRNGKIANLEQLLQRLGEAANGRDRVAIGNMVEVIGQKSFGPLLVFAGAVAFSPLSGIPGVPTLVALMVGLTAGQLLSGRKHFWLPRWLTRRTVSCERYQKALKTLSPFARLVDRLFRPRLIVLTQRVGAYVIAVVCLLIAATMPPMELIPFAATTAGAAIVAFGLSLIAHDGVMALIALTLTVTGAALAFRGIF